MIHSLEFSWYLVSRIYLFKTFFFSWNICPVFGISHVLHDSLKVANTDPIITGKVLLRTLGYGKYCLEMWSLLSPLGFYICTWKVILLEGCWKWLCALSNPLLAWSCSPLIQAGPGTRPSSLVTSASGEQARPQEHESSWPGGSVFSLFFHLTTPYSSIRTIPSLIFLLPRQLAQRPVLLFLAFWMTFISLFPSNSILSQFIWTV